MLNLIGLGLDVKSISVEALEAVKKSKIVFLESYTVDFPYKIKNLEKIIGKNKKIIKLSRNQVEDMEFLKNAKRKNISLLVYGSPLAATTHGTIVQECKKRRIKCEVYDNASIFTAVSLTGLQLYKFGKTASMPEWHSKKGFEPESFIEIIKENQSIGAHTLILIDINFSFINALTQLKRILDKRTNLKVDKILVASKLGTKKNKIIYGNLEQLEEYLKLGKRKKKESSKIKPPFVFIIPGKLHFVEKENLDYWEI